ncbi:hypothetical protein [Oceanithermus sp.]
MNPTKIKNLLIMAALLLVIYWSFVQPNAEGMAFSMGVLLGAGSVVFRRQTAELVVLVAILALLVAVVEVKNGVAAEYFIGLITGGVAPLVAFRMPDED